MGIGGELNIPFFLFDLFLKTVKHNPSKNKLWTFFKLGDIYYKLQTTYNVSSGYLSLINISIIDSRSKIRSSKPNKQKGKFDYY